MNTTGNNITVVDVNAIIHEEYVIHVFAYLSISALALLFYTTFSKLSQEIEYMWCKKFSLPTLFYFFTRYGSLIQQGLSFAITTTAGTGTTCNVLADMSNALSTLSSIGIQGLLIVRAYSICQGNKIITAALAFSLLSCFILNLYSIIAFPGCVSSSPVEDTFIRLGYNLTVIFTDVLLFSICMWKVWGTWRLKQKIGPGISGGSSLVSVLLKQSISRCCFVIIITIAGLVMSMIEIPDSSLSFFAVLVGFVDFQNALSAILVANFTLDLRRLNSAKIETNNASLPTLHFSSVLQHVHQSFITELATPEDIDMTMALEGDNHYHSGSGSMEANNMDTGTAPYEHSISSREE